ncbi:hypothetical protein C1645_803628 [Glomus cerebriforme]|uniref:Jacalin-type lectin domain-containing protein n=1 Tax=Glomus cerebriforme TaxID=658196 RepID=A0A397T7V0_9GLOM|nr:hypothetical protein C1645_803628 [Glomus cerebriforme]
MYNFQYLYIKLSIIIKNLRCIQGNWSKNSVTIDGTSHDYQGNKYGGNGGTKQDPIHTVDEQLTRISGRYGDYYGTMAIKFLEFRTSQNTYRFGNPGDTEDTAFTLPVGSDVHLEDWNHYWKYLWKTWKHNFLIKSFGLEVSNQVFYYWKHKMHITACGCYLWWW